MSRPFRALAVIAPLALLAPIAACAAFDKTGASSMSVNAIKGFVVAESGFDAMVETADLAIRSGKLSPAEIARIRGLTASGYACVTVGRSAMEAGNSTKVTAQTTTLAGLVTQLAQLTQFQKG